MVGSVNVDLVVTASALPAPGRDRRGRHVQRHGGGKSANQAVAAARLGARVRMVGAVGDDDLGEEAMAALWRGDRCRRGRAVEGSPTGVALIVVDAAARTRSRSLRRQRGARRRRGRSGAAQRGRRRGAARLRGPRRARAAGARAARAAGLEVRREPRPGRELPAALLEHSPLLTPNLDEARALAGEQDPEAAARALAARTGAPVVVTLGADGALVVDGETLERIPAPRVEVVDTTGAGDAFNGALACELAGGAALLDAVRSAIRSPLRRRPPPARGRWCPSLPRGRETACPPPPPPRDASSSRSTCRTTTPARPAASNWPSAPRRPTGAPSSAAR